METKLFKKGDNVYILENYTKNPYASPTKVEGKVMGTYGKDVTVKWADGSRSTLNQRFLNKNNDSKAKNGANIKGGGNLEKDPAIIRTQFEEEEYEYKNGANIKGKGFEKKVYDYYAEQAEYGNAPSVVYAEIEADVIEKFNLKDSEELHKILSKFPPLVKAKNGANIKGGDIGDTIADRYARLTKAEGKRLDELSKKVRINEQTKSEDIEWDKLVHKYRGWDYKYAKGGGVGTTFKYEIGGL